MYCCGYLRLYPCLESVYLEYSHSGVTKQQLSNAHSLELYESSQTEWYKSLGNSFQVDTVNLVFSEDYFWNILFSDYEAIFQDYFTDIDSSYDTEEILNSNSDEENKLLYLTKMGYSEVEALIAIERSGLDSSIAELTDFICAAQMAKATETLLPRKLEKKPLNEGDNAVHLPNLIIGFGVPTEPDQITQRTLPKDAIGPPYFYYENVAFTPIGSAKLTERIRKALEAYDDELPSSVHNDAEVAFYCLGIHLKTDAQELNSDRLEQLMSRFGEFDLVVGGIQLTGSSATSR
ncbi:DNA (Cytosine-5)-methyltransferase DRM1/2 isoform 3 [Hibiscus syriacus]|uniref:DNA (Cytosine-5)-methyltransferase DRM1/2 isoform 3 n=1 Tax=Hibiscus syriacus TaxID=106335 RepID=A0A6A3CRS8_HIBSY|nr:DNA (Cytosine-5)-methyltransferase DRM1/2 isoform 3 [Hibiscus syriacus]